MLDRESGRTGERKKKSKADVTKQKVNLRKRVLFLSLSLSKGKFFKSVKLVVVEG